MSETVILPASHDRTCGLVPRYLRERQAAHARMEALARAPDVVATAPAPTLPLGAGPVDAATAELRRRLAAARPARRAPLAVVAPAFASAALLRTYFAHA